MKSQPTHPKRLRTSAVKSSERFLTSAVTGNVERPRPPLRVVGRAKWGMAGRIAVSDFTNEEGRKLLSIVPRGSGSVVRWRRAQIVLWPAQHMDAPAIAKVAFTSEDRVQEVLHNFNPDGVDSFAPSYEGGRRPSSRPPNGARSRRSRSSARRTTSSLSPSGRSPSWPTTWRERGDRGHQPRGTPGASL